MAAPLFARPPRDAEEERKIRKLAGARHAPADWVLRARMITASWAGKTVSTIAAELGCKPRTVRMRLHRFNAEGLDGPGDQPIPGRPPRLGEADRRGLIGLVKQPPPGRSVRNETGELVAGEPARRARMDPGRSCCCRPGRRHRDPPQPGAADPAVRRGAVAAHLGHQ